MTSDDLGCDPITHQRRAMIAIESVRINDAYEPIRHRHDVIVVNGAPTFKGGIAVPEMKETTSTANDYHRTGSAG